MNIILKRINSERGAWVGHLLIDHDKVCDTVECREVALKATLHEGEAAHDRWRPDGMEGYPVALHACRLFRRQMPLAGFLPSPDVCARCMAEMREHRVGDVAERRRLPCSMMQFGNGPFALRYGSILIGKACHPGYVVDSYGTFQILFYRIQKSIERGHRVRLLIADPMPDE